MSGLLLSPVPSCILSRLALFTEQFEFLRALLSALDSAVAAAVAPPEEEQEDEKDSSFLISGGGAIRGAPSIWGTVNVAPVLLFPAVAAGLVPAPPRLLLLLLCFVGGVVLRTEMLLVNVLRRRFRRALISLKKEKIILYCKLFVAPF